MTTSRITVRLIGCEYNGHEFSVGRVIMDGVLLPRLIAAAMDDYSEDEDLIHFGNREEIVEWFTEAGDLTPEEAEEIVTTGLDVWQRTTGGRTVQ